jgi:hypothetical protein
MTVVKMAVCLVFSIFDLFAIIVQESWEPINELREINLIVFFVVSSE